MARTDPHFRLRIPADLKDRIEAAASKSNRSINAEILSRLEGSFETGDITELVRRVDRLEESAAAKGIFLAPFAKDAVKAVAAKARRTRRGTTQT